MSNKRIPVFLFKAARLIFISIYLFVSCLGSLFLFPKNVLADTIAFDSSAGANVATPGSNNTLTIPLTVADASNRMLVVGVGSEGTVNTNNYGASGVTYNGVAMTRIDGGVYNNGGSSTYNYISLWYLIAPATGTHDVVVSFAVTPSTGASAIAVSLNGVAQSAPEASASLLSDVSNPHSLNISTLSNNAWVVDVFSTLLSSVDATVGTGQTSRGRQSQMQDTQMSTKPVATAGATSTSWTGTNDVSGIISAAFAPAAGSTSLTSIGDITGTMQVGSTLTAGAVSPEGATVSYQWTEADTADGTYSNISGATSSTYVLQSSDSGKYLKVAATGTGSYAGTVTSNATSQIQAAGSTSLTSIGDITGTMQVGYTLTAGAVSPEGATVSYQWTEADTADGTYSNISGATSSTYVLQSSDSGKYLKVAATGTGSYAGTVTSNATSQIQAVSSAIAFDSSAGANVATPGSNNTLTIPLTVADASNRMLVVGVGSEGTVNTNNYGASGVTYNGVAMTRINGGMYNNGVGTTYNYISLWYLIAPATGTHDVIVSFTVTPSTGASAIAVSLNGVEQAAPEASANVLADTSNPHSLNIATLSDNAWVVDVFGSLNSTTNATVGTGQVSRGRQSQQQDTQMSTKLVASAGSASTTWTSNTDISGIISAAFAPVRTSLTSIGDITGTVQAGSTLTAGAVSPEGATVSYQWSRSTTSNGTYSNISGATSGTYTPVAGDVGYYLKVAATGTGSYKGTVTSNPTSQIPTISLSSIADITGTFQVGYVLTAGAVSPEGATVSYQWTEADTAGGTYSNISGATSGTYTLQPSDLGKYLKVAATGTGSYAGTVTSGATSQIQASIGPVLTQATPVTSPTNDTTPNYTFNSTGSGSITYGGDCSSSTTAAVVGSNTITFNTLSAGTHSNCTIRVTDAESQQSNILSVNSFTIDLTLPTVTSVTTTTSSGTYDTGTSIPVTVNFSKPVTSTGNVTVTLNTTPSKSCTFSLNNATSGSCTYTVQLNDRATNLDATITGTITDQAGNVMVNFVPASNLSAGKAINISGTSTKIAFIGNSLTQGYGGNYTVPYIVCALRNMDQSNCTGFVVGGTGFAYHWNSTSDRTDLQSSNWNYVVLNDLSANPYNQYANGNTDLATYGPLWSNFIENLSGTPQPVFYETWEHSQALVSDGMIQPFNHMADFNIVSQLNAANPAKPVLLAPVGDAQKTAQIQYPGASYYYDGTHGTDAAYYLAGLVIYSTIFNESPVGLTWMPTGMSQDDATYFQTLAWNTVHTPDTTAPVVTINSPSAGMVSGDVTLNMSATDASPFIVTNMRFYVDNVATPGTGAFYLNNNAAKGAAGTSSPHSVTWDSRTVADGTHTISAIANDSALNYGTSSVSVTVGNAAPTSISSGTPTSTGATITWNTNNTANTQINWGLTSSYGNSSTLDASYVTSHSVSLSGLRACTKYHYRARSTDNSAFTNLGLSADNYFYTGGCVGDAAVSSSSENSITQAGGELDLGGMHIDIPSSFSGTSSAVFQAKQIDNTAFIAAAGLPNGKRQAGTNVYNLEALTDASTVISSFDNPISVTLTYSAQDVSNVIPSSLQIYRYDSGIGWTALDSCSVNTTNRTVTCQTSNFSDFSLFGNQATSSSLTLASSQNPSDYNQSVTFTATVSPSDATGTVQFQDGGNNLGSAVNISGGSATYQTSSLSAGSHSITAIYSGNSTYGSSTSNTVTQQVDSADATLSDLALSSSSLSPAFASGTSTYTSTVANDIASITLTPTANEAHASISINGASVNSGSASNPISLSVGANVITVTVTAQDGDTNQAYVITITRSAASSGGSGGGAVYAKPTVNAIQITKVEGSSVTLSLNVGNASQMILSDSSSFPGSWITYATNYVYTKKDDQSKIYIKFKSSSGGVSSVVSLDIPSSINNISPIFFPVQGTYKNSVTVSLSASEGASIYYTLDGTTPTIFSSLYTLPFALVKTATVKAIAVKTGYLNSSISTSHYTVTTDINASDPYPAGTLLKLPDSPKVYVVIEGKKKWISTPEVFEQLGYKWTSITTVSQEQLNTLSDFEDNLIRAIGDYKVYLVVNGVKRHIPNPQIFLDYGFNWNDVKDVEKAVIEKYKDVYLIKESGKNEVYYVNPEGIRKLIPNPEIMASYDDRMEDVQIISKKEMEHYPLSSVIRLKNNLEVYFIQSDTRKYVSAVAAKRYKIDLSQVMSVNQYEFDWYKDGGNLN